MVFQVGYVFLLKETTGFAEVGDVELAIKTQDYLNFEGIEDLIGSTLCGLLDGVGV